ncbi:hypothetical protein DP43_4896 [Burkholderia pseudomallei]|nr:hypothetical protein DP43_4896 [Burkholderia pseudomallei]
MPVSYRPSRRDYSALQSITMELSHEKESDCFRLCRRFRARRAVRACAERCDVEGRHGDVEGRDVQRCDVRRCDVERRDVEGCDVEGPDGQAARSHGEGRHEGRPHVEGRDERTDVVRQDESDVELSGALRRVFDDANGSVARALFGRPSSCGAVRRGKPDRAVRAGVRRASRPRTGSHR